MKIPCKNCLVFPMCKSKVTSLSHPREDFISIEAFRVIATCPLLTEWIGRCKKEGEVIYRRKYKRLDKAAKFLATPTKDKENNG